MSPWVLTEAPPPRLVVFGAGSQPQHQDTATVAVSNAAIAVCRVFEGSEYAELTLICGHTITFARDDRDGSALLCEWGVA